MLGIIFSIISAFWFGLSAVGLRRGVASASALNGLYLTVLPGVPLFWLAALVTGQVFDAGELAIREYALLGGAGVLHFLFGRYCTLRAYAAIGANRATPVIAGSLLVSVSIAMLLLDEKVTALMGVGTVLVLIGPGLAASQPRKRTEAPTAAAVTSPPSAPAAGGVAGPPVRLAEGYLWAALNTLAFGASPILIKEALGDSGLGVLGGAIAYSTAALLLLIPLSMPGQLAGLRSTGATAQRWFLIGAFTIFAAQMFRFLALSNAPVTVVVPLMRGAVIFALLFGFMFNRSIESFDTRVLAGIVLSTIGAVALVI